MLRPGTINLHTMEEQQNDKRDTIIPSIEALLFVNGEALSIKKIAELLGVTDEAASDGLKTLSEVMKLQNRGLDLIVSDGKAMLVTKPELGEVVKKLVKDEFDSELTPAALETLSIVSYLGPITRAEIDYIRGVNSSFILRNLMVRGLVNKDQSKNLKSQISVCYDITFDFLRHMGVSAREDLPDYMKYKGLLRGFIEGETGSQVPDKPDKPFDVAQGKENNQ